MAPLVGRGRAARRSVTSKAEKAARHPDDKQDEQADQNALDLHPAWRAGLVAAVGAWGWVSQAGLLLRVNVEALPADFIETLCI